MSEFVREQLRPGFYRVRREPRGCRFGQIKKTGPGKWEAEIRMTGSGDLYRFAGIWPTLRDAQQEIEGII